MQQEHIEMNNEIKSQLPYCTSE